MFFFLIVQSNEIFSGSSDQYYSLPISRSAQIGPVKKIDVFFIFHFLQNMLVKAVQ